MYQLKKAPLFEDDLELLDESGVVNQTIHVSLHLDDLLGRYNETINALRAAEDAVQPENEASMEAYGEIVMQLLRLIFRENADVILTHYEGRYLSMLEQVMPYILDVIGPKLREMSRRRIASMKAARRDAV